MFTQEPGDSQVSGHCGEKKNRGLAVVVGLLVKLSQRVSALVMSAFSLSCQCLRPIGQ